MRLLRARALIFALVGALAVGACSRAKSDAVNRDKPEPAGSAHEDEAEHGEAPRKVRISREVIDASKISWATAKREPLERSLRLPGEIVADPDRSARVASPVAGRLDRVDFHEGANVKKGELLATVRAPELGRLRAERAGASAKASAARANAKRKRALVEKGMASEQDAVDTEAEADALESQARGLGTDLAAIGGGGNASVGLRAPVSGVVLTRDAVVGQPVNSDQTLAQIADLSEVWFLGRVFEKDLGRIRIGAAAEVELNAYPKEHFAGTVELLGKQVDSVARTLTVRVRLKNRNDLLRLGLFGTARIAESDAAKAEPKLVVSRNALSDVGGKTVVFVHHPDDDFELHEVTLGDSGVGTVEVVSGLREGEEVVTEGAFAVKSALLRSTLVEEE